MLNVIQGEIQFKRVVLRSAKFAPVISQDGIHGKAMIMGPCGYQLKNHLKSGIPLAILITIVMVFYLPINSKKFRSAR